VWRLFVAEYAGDRVRGPVWTRWRSESRRLM